MKKKERYKIHLDEDGKWRYRKEDTSIMTLSIWAFIAFLIVSIIFLIIS